MRATRGTATTGRSNPGPLSRERIISEALALIEEIGLADFSTRKLGQRLGCEAMALYHYFATKEQLLDGVAELILSKIPLPQRTDAGWVGQVRDYARSYRALARMYPRSFLLLAARHLATPMSHRLLDRIFGELLDAGLTPKTAAQIFRVVGNYASGTALDDLAGIAAIRQGTDPSNVGEGALATDPPANLARVAPYLSPSTFDEIFEYGLELLIEGFRRTVEAEKTAKL